MSFSLCMEFWNLLYCLLEAISVICKMQLKTFYINNTLVGFVTGSYPEITGVVNTLKACKVQFPDDCAETWDLEVKNCGSFMVFHLTFLQSCSGRYCMGM